MRKSFWAILLISLGLAGCTGVSNFAVGDLTLAASLANMPNVSSVPVSPTAIDPSGAQCWGTLAPGVAAISKGTNPGFAVLVEVARVGIIMSRQNGPCGALAAPILSQLSVLPGAGNAIAIAATSVR